MATYKWKINGRKNCNKKDETELEKVTNIIAVDVLYTMDLYLKQRNTAFLDSQRQKDALIVTYLQYWKFTSESAMQETHFTFHVSANYSHLQDNTT